MSARRVAVVVVARQGSRRLPGKMLETLAGGTVLGYTLQRCCQIKSASEVILATTVAAADDALAAEAEALGIRVVRGSEDDVVARMEQAVGALSEPCDLVVRACADNPLFMPGIVDLAIEELCASGCDIITPFEHATLPFGYGFVVMTRECLGRIHAEAKDGAYREHVENFCFEHPDQFRIRYQVAPEGLAWPELCLTLDYRVDLVRLRRLAEFLAQVPIADQPHALLNHLQSKHVWVEGLHDGSPPGGGLVILAEERPGSRATGEALVVDTFEVQGLLRYGLRYQRSGNRDLPQGPVYLDENPNMDGGALRFLERVAKRAVPFLLAAPARPLENTEMVTPPQEKRVLGKRRLGFQFPAEASYPVQIVLDHAERSTVMLGELLLELEVHEGTELFLSDPTQGELAQAIQHLGARRVHIGAPEPDPFRVLKVCGSSGYELAGARSQHDECSITGFWRSSHAQRARATMLNQGDCS